MYIKYPKANDDDDDNMVWRIRLDYPNRKELLCVQLSPLPTYSPADGRARTPGKERKTESAAELAFLRKGKELGG